MESNIVLEGRKLIISRAIDRERAREQAVVGTENKKNEKRSVYFFIFLFYQVIFINFYSLTLTTLFLSFFSGIYILFTLLLSKKTPPSLKNTAKLKWRE